LNGSLIISAAFLAKSLVALIFFTKDAHLPSGLAINYAEAVAGDHLQAGVNSLSPRLPSSPRAICPDLKPVSLDSIGSI